MFKFEGKIYIWIKNFSKHQKITHMGKSTINGFKATFINPETEVSGNFRQILESTSLKEGRKEGLEFEGKEGLEGDNARARDPLPPVGDVYKIETPLQRVIVGWKIVTGVARDDRAWDKMHWTRTAKSAGKLLEYLGGDVKKTVDCMQDIYDELTVKGFTCTVETVGRHSTEWKNKHEPNNYKSVGTK